MHHAQISDTPIITAPHGAGLANLALAIGGLAIGTG
ncbi:MFS transporter, DHA1 family, inner membrane transport protein [Duganella sacchari]|uniref:MFS transporter, DHA1 family, inner membrane transport protein n=1 Tax=Duganella sacchari TaxID=551987 RepID=A0A1M7QW90_9BURK|nr:MFS transporter, DHA1 family, inner membrane transport protein [Duganella sacchari]